MTTTTTNTEAAGVLTEEGIRAAIQQALEENGVGEFLFTFARVVERCTLAAASAQATTHERWKLVPLDRSYGMRVNAIIAFNAAEKSGKDRDDALEAAYQAMLTAAPTAPQPPATAPVIDKSMVKRLATQFGLVPDGDVVRDAERWQWARANLLSVSFQSGPHKQNVTNINPLGDANTAAFWDALADTALSQPKQEG